MMEQQTEQKTATEWLAQQISDIFYVAESSEMKKMFKWVNEQAKELERQQHGVTWDSAIKAHDDRGHVHSRSITDFDEYFEETYNK